MNLNAREVSCSNRLLGGAPSPRRKALPRQKKLRATHECRFRRAHRLGHRRARRMGRRYAQDRGRLALGSAEGPTNNLVPDALWARVVFNRDLDAGRAILLNALPRLVAQPAAYQRSILSSAHQLAFNGRRLSVRNLLADIARRAVCHRRVRAAAGAR